MSFLMPLKAFGTFFGQRAIDFFSQTVKWLLFHHHQKMNGKATDETEDILPFERTSQSLAYQKNFHALLEIFQTTSK